MHLTFKSIIFTTTVSNTHYSIHTVSFVSFVCLEFCVYNVVYLNMNITFEYFGIGADKSPQIRFNQSTRELNY